MQRHSHYFFLCLEKVKADLLSEIRSGYFGILWWVIEPLMYMAVFYIVFEFIFYKGDENRIAFLLIGLVIWKWFASTVSRSSNCIAVNMGLINKVYIPKIIFPVIVLITNTIKFIIIFILLIGILLFSGIEITKVWISIPLLLFIQLFFIFAVGSFFSAFVPFLPDLKLIIDNALMLLFFLSGIFFDINAASPPLKSYLFLNPIAGLIDNYRKVILHGIWPDWSYLQILFYFSIVMILACVFLLKRYDREYPKIL